MGLETATFISDLVATNPIGATDPKSQGDDHIRLLKSTIKASFPNITGAVTATQAELNVLDGITASTAELNILDGVTATAAEINHVSGVTSPIQGQLDAKQPLDADLTAIAGLASAGMVSRTGAGTAAVRTLTAGAGIQITNGDGVSGNPTIALTASAGLGDVNGPGSATDNAVARYDLTTGKLLQNSTVTISDGGDVAGVASINGGQLAGLRNKIINGNFGINQRAYVSGAATTAGQYTLDRWKVTGTGGVTFSTTANKTTVTIPSGQTLQQVIDGLNLESGTYVLSWEGTAQGRIAGGSYGASGAVTASITGGTNTTIEFNTGTVALVMLEKGTVATPFEHRPYGMELALCQRYYYRLTAPSLGDSFGVGFASTTTVASTVVWFPVAMRSAPTALDQSGTATDYSLLFAAGTIVNCSVVPTFNTASTSNARITATVASGLTAGQAVVGRFASTAGYLGWSAEL